MQQNADQPERVTGLDLVEFAWGYLVRQAEPMRVHELDSTASAVLRWFHCLGGSIEWNEIEAELRTGTHRAFHPVKDCITLEQVIDGMPGPRVAAGNRTAAGSCYR